MQEGNRAGEAILHGGIVHCPGGHRTWTVSWFDGEFKLFCTKCKRCFRIYIDEGIMKVENVSAGVE